jgi:hypothetical protein
MHDDDNFQTLLKIALAVLLVGLFYVCLNVRKRINEALAASSEFELTPHNNGQRRYGHGHGHGAGAGAGAGGQGFGDRGSGFASPAESHDQRIQKLDRQRTSLEESAAAARRQQQAIRAKKEQEQVAMAGGASGTTRTGSANGSNSSGYTFSSDLTGLPSALQDIARERAAWQRNDDSAGSVIV